MNEYKGKRFAGLLLIVVVLAVSYFWGDAEKFTALTTTLGLIYGLYVGGQSYTDGRGSDGDHG